jgi:hypothetical protein
VRGALREHTGTRRSDDDVRDTVAVDIAVAKALPKEPCNAGAWMVYMRN